MASMKLGKGERLVLMRHRSGISQEDAAKKMRVGRFIYGAWERGEVPEKMMPTVKLFRRVTELERLMLYRKRSHMTQRRLAMYIGVSRYWLNLMENGGADCAKLKEFWDKELRYDTMRLGKGHCLGEPYGRENITA